MERKRRYLTSDEEKAIVAMKTRLLCGTRNIVDVDQTVSQINAIANKNVKTVSAAKQMNSQRYVLEHHTHVPLNKYPEGEKLDSGHRHRTMCNKGERVHLPNSLAFTIEDNGKRMDFIINSFYSSQWATSRYKQGIPAIPGQSENLLNSENPRIEFRNDFNDFAHTKKIALVIKYMCYENETDPCVEVYFLVKSANDTTWNAGRKKLVEREGRVNVVIAFYPAQHFPVGDGFLVTAVLRTSHVNRQTAQLHFPLS